VTMLSTSSLPTDSGTSAGTRSLQSAT